MKFYSTKNRSLKVSLKEALFQGLPADKGLFMPDQIHPFPDSFFKRLPHLSLPEIGFEVSKQLLSDEIDNSNLHEIVDQALTFDAPLVRLENRTFIMELFHGPTLAFKDFGARYMAHLLGYFLDREEKELHILVATSGDTGSAVGHGFLNVPGIKVTLLYPKGKVSFIQEKQLTTIGGNVSALEVSGTFDDCQRMVKEAFLDPDLAEKMWLTSANSINIGRLIPQSFYYFHAFARLHETGLPLFFSVPSGNFGNLCGGLIASRMGLPVVQFIASTNANKVFPDFLESGKFQPQPSIHTISNAMDVGNPSNFARIMSLFDADLGRVKQEISGYWFDDAQTKEAIRQVHQNQDYLMCPHTAVGYLGWRKFEAESGLSKPANGVILATAHPSKFKDIVDEVVGDHVVIPPRLGVALGKQKLSLEIPAKLEDLKNYLLAN